MCETQQLRSEHHEREASRPRGSAGEARQGVVACDVLSGREQIARWFGLTCGQCDARIGDGSIAVFKLPGKSTTYCLKSENTRRWSAAAEAYRNRSNGLT